MWDPPGLVRPTVPSHPSPTWPMLQPEDHSSSRSHISDTLCGISSQAFLVNSAYLDESGDEAPWFDFCSSIHRLRADTALEHRKASSDMGMALPCLLRTGQEGITRTPTPDIVPWLDTLPGSALWYLALGRYTTVCNGRWIKDHTALVHFCEPGHGSPKSDVLF